MSKAEIFLQSRLSERTAAGLLRKLTVSRPLIDFCSNDYLGFARSSVLELLTQTNLAKLKTVSNGATGSRLLSGNTAYTEQTERFIADFHQAEAGLIYNSGYDANVGLLSSIPQRGDTIISDELIHASLIDGARLSYAERYKFKHNDVQDLEQKLKIARGLTYVVVESVYSMDGDLAPLKEINAICKKYKANLIVDEAHATGVFGPQGKGLVVELELENEVFARVITFGKAIGTHGAIVLGSKILRNYLINFSRSFIYTTAAPVHAIVTIKSAYKLLYTSTEQIKLLKNIALYNALIAAANFQHIKSESAIQTLVLGDNSTTTLLASKLQEKGFDVRAILSPTVPIGKERLRICLHSYNTEKEINDLVASLKKTN